LKTSKSSSNDEKQALDNKFKGSQFNHEATVADLKNRIAGGAITVEFALSAANACLYVGICLLY
jgi:hypothetical protein